jgi:hypothetical protein
VGVLESVTVTVKSALPAAVGVPEITPELLSVSPAGSAPAVSVQVKGVTPPLAVRVSLYAVPTMPSGNRLVVMVSPAIVMWNGWLTVCAVGVLESVTVTAKSALPAAVGVPEITPELLRVSPAGSAPAVSVQV